MRCFVLVLPLDPATAITFDRIFLRTNVASFPIARRVLFTCSMCTLGRGSGGAYSTSAAIGLDDYRFAIVVRDAGDNFTDDEIRILGAGVVAGDVDCVGDADRGARHSRPLGSVAVAPAAEQNPQATPR